MGTTLERRVTITSPVGLHARPAAVFVKAAAETGVRVTLLRPGGPSADARSILSVLALDVRQGDEVILQVDGPAEVLDRLADLLGGDLS